MKIFYERVVIGAVTLTTPYFSAMDLPISEGEHDRACLLSPSGMQLFALVVPQSGQEERFKAEITSLVTYRYIRVLPELCDDEGRALVAHIVPETAKSVET